ncbi:WecB/TagA/CpsF family glycosyltransferase [Clostridium sp.]|uniref:WecB/TagA/CpsF family glycosyltransferase n=1 Tax=Clostridium sp. TaxID=1506 RepID=UPI0026099852|nr:WecB/TagA/CpsF family glycosyltransferase [Clostridium sp.]
MENKDFINVLNYKIYKNSLSDALKYIEKFKKVHIVSGNPEVLFQGLEEKELLDNFLSEEAFIIPDGVGIQLAASYLKTPVKEKIAGIEFMKAIINKCEENNRGIYLIGTTEENIKDCVANLMVKYPKINISGYRNGFFDLEKSEDIVRELNEKKPYAVFVAMGCPRQERFIIRNFNNINCKILMGVGGSFDIIADKMKRAPRWMIKLGLEWLYRVIKEPFRIKRLGRIPKFLIKVIKEK